MTLPSGARLGPYEIAEPVGAGGMGEVYRAVDTRLSRQVAVKLLPPALAGDPHFRERFEREARVVSSLDHPHICALHDVGEHDGMAYLVLPFLQGETLADRIARGPLPVGEALRVGAEIADGLAAAHRRGIAHRDLKPGNVMLTSSGVRILDFGLAKAGAGAVPVEGVTQTRPLTAQGTLLGTLNYMAPEQVEGREADARSDIWALGCVLHEMLTGARPFDGQSPASVIGSILRDVPPPVSTRVATSSRALDRVVGKCLEKDPDRRWQSAADLRDELRWIGERQPETARPVHGARRAGAVLAAAVLAAAGMATVWWMRDQSRAEPARLTRLSVVLPPEVAFEGSPVLSPDGTRLAFVGRAGGRALLHIRQLDELEPRLLAGTEDAALPFWSPDGRSIAFFSESRLRRIDANGSALQTIADAANARGGSWNRDGVIVFAPSPTSGLHAVSAGGGTPAAVTHLNSGRGENSHRFPEFIEGGRQFLFRIRSQVVENTGIYVASLDGGEPRRLLTADSSALSIAGFVLFARESTLFAHRFDARRLELTGEPVAVANGVGYDTTTARGGFSVSNTGAVAYYPGGREGSETGRFQLTWFDRGGRELGRIGDVGLPLNPAISPDGRFVAFDRVMPQTGTRNIWLTDLARNVTSRFTFSSAVEAAPVWMPDSQSLLFMSSREGATHYYRKPRTAGAAEEKFASPGPNSFTPGSLSADGRWLAFLKNVPGTRVDIWVMALEDEGSSRPFATSPFEERQPQFSPDGRWLAYSSDESGRYEVYVHSFPDGREKLRVSTAGGVQPQWRRDGRELFYLGLDQRLVAVPISLQQGTLTTGNPQPLFSIRITSLTQNRNDYVPDAAGQRFLVSMGAAEQLTAPIIVVQNWQQALRR